MLGVKFNVFRQATWLENLFLRAKKYDYRTGMLTAGLPMFATITVLWGVSIVIMDQQLEMAHKRLQTVTQRELTLQQEHESLKKFLYKKTGY